MRSLFLMLFLLAACEPVLEQDVVAVKVPTVDVRIANLWRVADDILVNELDVWEHEGYECEKKFVETDEIQLGNGAVFIALRELHACWKVTYETVLQPAGFGG